MMRNKVEQPKDRGEHDSLMYIESILCKDEDTARCAARCGFPNRCGDHCAVHTVRYHRCLVCIPSSHLFIPIKDPCISIARAKLSSRLICVYCECREMRLPHLCSSKSAMAAEETGRPVAGKGASVKPVFLNWLKSSSGLFIWASQNVGGGSIP